MVTIVEIHLLILDVSVSQHDTIELLFLSDCNNNGPCSRITFL